MGVAYDNELDKTVELNVVVLIGTDYYAIKAPDSGLSITSEYLQVKKPRLNGVTVDIRNSNTPIGTFSFQLMEFEYNKTSSKIMVDTTNFLDKTCIVYLGHITGSFDFSDYIEVARTKITNVTKISNGYSIKSKEVAHLIDKPALNEESISKTALLATSTSVTLEDSSGFPSTGTIRIDSEFMTYSANDTGTGILSGLSRGVKGSDATTHDVGAEVYLVTEITAINPLDILLQMLISDTGDGSKHATYDVLSGGLAIPVADIDIAGIEAIRDEHFLGEQHSLDIWGQDSILKYLEKFLLPSTNLRFITVNGKISLSLLDQVDFAEETPIINGSAIVGTPTWTLTSDKIVNVVEVLYDYNFATGKYETSNKFTDSDSITTFGEKKKLVVKMPSVKTSLNGAAIATDRASRLLGRLSTARGKIDLTAHFDKSNIVVGSNVQIVHKDLPQQGGSLGLSDQLEIMSRSIDIDRGTVKYALEFTSYTGIRIPFIGPSPKITAVTDQKTFTVDDASCLKEGYPILLFEDGPLVDGDPTAGSYLPDGLNVIQSIVGNIITMEDSFTTTLEIDFWIKLPDYNDAIEEQRARYAFIGENTGFFFDGSKSYQIIY